MAVNNVQKLSFLGGLVSPSLYLRSDLDKFGKWFSTADNIRFNTVGSLENRFGTVHVATTKENSSGKTIKLIKFVFNSNESCLLELGSNYCRVYKDTTYITEIETTINPETDGDIKYAQSGDTIFVATTKGLYELIRTSKDFTSWTFRNFDWSNGLMPLDEENDNKSKTITLATSSVSTSWAYTVYNVDRENYLYSPVLKFTISGSQTTVFSYDGKISYSNFISSVNSAITSYNITASFTNTASATPTLSFVVNAGQVTSVENISLNYSYYSQQSAGTGYTITIPSLSRIYKIMLFDYYGQNGAHSYTREIPFLSDDINTVISYYNSNVPSNTVRVVLLNSSSDPTWQIQGQTYANGNWTHSDTYNRMYVYYWQLANTDANYIGPSTGNITYTASTSFDFFSDKQPNEIFAIRNTVDASNIHVIYDGSVKYSLNGGADTTTVQTFLSDGNWRYNSSGLWNGTVNLYYSKDKGTTWIKFFTRTNTNYSNYSTVNDNTSGNIDTGDLVLLKIEATITGQNNDSKFAAELACKQFDVNSYYKIYTITSGTAATVYAIRNDVGEITSSADWRESVFSSAKGYPTAIGFYQNRLFLGKDYILYGSATDDFWDFYEPTSVKDNDPVTMSLLGYQVDTIQNIVTMRSFFVFTTGGEFGIGSEGALTQADKYLKQLSAHGSNECNPIFCGDIVVFVDSSGNTVRAFQYSLDVDSYEATDVSVLIEQILKGKTIKTTEYLKHSKECLFLTTDGEIYVFKFYQEQNIAAWSVWKHAKYTVTNLCVVPSSNNTEILYIACDTDYGKVIEKFDASLYCDSLHTYTAGTATDTFTTDFQKDDIVVVNDGTDINYLVTVGNDGVITTRNNTTSVTVGLRYKSVATVLSPEIPQQDGTFTTFHKKRPFRVHLFYRDSYGFKVGVEDYDTQEIQYQEINAFIDQEDDLVSGKANVLVPARFDGNSRVTFVQELPYPMHIENVLIETDYGGK